ncbi:Angiotensin-converting enzyme, partial [Blattella germanica]
EFRKGCNRLEASREIFTNNYLLFQYHESFNSSIGVLFLCFSSLNALLGRMQQIYSEAQICRRNICYRGEPDLERLMQTSRDPAELLWSWQQWRETVGPPIKLLYPAVVSLLNQGARNNGYQDIGECWREELETPDLEETVERLYQQVEPLYRLLHAVVRYRLVQLYGTGEVSPTGPIPAHLLVLRFSCRLQSKNYTTLSMLKRAEDFYTSLGLEPMTSSFWKNSILDKPRGYNGTCHGTAANMFKPGDYRMLLCADVTAEDFYVMHHEMGHVEYYMAYKNQPIVFQDGATSALQEAVGDSIMYGVMTSSHLERLGLGNRSDDFILLLRQALGKIPQLPFGLIIDKWRWNVFRGAITSDQYNEAWWELRRQYQGVMPPIPRSHKDFDPAAKFHIPDNTPYIRYFLSEIIQVQMFKGMCEAAIYGRVDSTRALPMPLHQCDIYGSKQAGRRLRAMMSLGSSQPWGTALRFLTGTSTYDVEPLLEYYAPVYQWLQQQIEELEIPVGWD